MTQSTSTNPTYSVVEVTPAFAQELLDTSEWNNRPLSIPRVNRYVRDMIRGEWQFNGEPLIRSPRGNMLNGQHRLHAVVRAGVPVRFGILEGIEENTFLTMDTGRTRTVGDALSIAGEPYGANMASTLTFLHHLLSFGDVRGPSFDPSRVEIARLLDRLGSDKIQNSIRLGRRVYTSTGVSPSFLAALHLYLSLYNQEKANYFFNTLAVGDGLYPGNPIRALRTRFLNNRFGRARTDLREVLSVTVQAWNAYRRAQQMARTQYNANKAIPKPV